jgi:soluble lytic murein transglycosylase-like protein
MWVACCVLVLAPGVPASDVVMFEDGRTLKVAAWEASGSDAVLSLLSGGQIIVPLSRIQSVARFREVATESEQAGTAVAGTPAAWEAGAGEFAEAIAGTAQRYGLDPALLAAVAAVESNFDPYAISHKGACGILQLIPATAERFGVDDLFDPQQNLDGGAGYLRWLLDRFNGQTELALAAYNAGEGAVDRHGGIPPYPETRDYVKRVMARHRNTTPGTDLIADP